MWGRFGLMLACSSPSCAYYNALYNANQLAERARAAQEQGSPAEARSLWEQVAIKAESVTIRHPGSKYFDDALLLQGIALSQLERCREAIAPLSGAESSSPDPLLVNRARYLLGRCYVATDEPAMAMEVLDSLLENVGSGEGSRPALLWRGRAALAMSRYGEATEDLARSGDPQARLGLAFGLAHLRRWDELDSLLGAALRRGYDEPAWLGALDGLGSGNSEAARALVNRLDVRSELTELERARLLIADGNRLEAAGRSSEGAERFRSVASRLPDATLGRLARVRLILNRLRFDGAPASVPAVLRELEASSRGGPAAELAAPAISILRRIVTHVRGRPGSDAELFLLGELARDSLLAPLLAGSLFRRVQFEHPESAIAPKALLAAAWAEPGARADLIERLRSDYPKSPYARALSGEDPAGFSAAEASLHREAAQPIGAERTTRLGPDPARPPPGLRPSRTRPRAPGPEP